MNDWREKVYICCKNCKYRKKYTSHCSLLNKDILLTDYCSMSVFEEREDVPIAEHTQINEVCEDMKGEIK